jgi:hypothetical protein
LGVISIETPGVGGRKRTKGICEKKKELDISEG